MGIEDESCSVMFRIKVTEECPQNCCFARSHLSCQGNESYTMVDAIKKVCKCLFMVFAQEDKTGVWGQVKRFFPEAMKIKVHRMIPLNASTLLIQKGEK